MMYRGKKVHKGTKPGVFYIMVGDKKQYIPKKERAKFENSGSVITGSENICSGLRY